MAHDNDSRSSSSSSSSRAKSTTTTPPSTYYDSQSGMTVPVHKEHEISLFANLQQRRVVVGTTPETYDSTSSTSLVDDPASLATKVQSLKNEGFSGMYLDDSSSSCSTSTTTTTTGRWDDTAKDDDSSSSRALQILLSSSTTTTPPDKMTHDCCPDHVNLVFSYYSALDDDSLDSIEEQISTHLVTQQQQQQQQHPHTNQKVRTTISLLDYDPSMVANTNGTTATNNSTSSRRSDDPISVASAVAGCIDATGGGDLIWVPGPNQEDLQSSPQQTTLDDRLALCEELLYLDVAGPTMKSRLLIDISGCVGSNDEKEEWMEECLTMGMNKFMIHESQLVWFQHRLLHHDQGKSLHWL